MASDRVTAATAFPARTNISNIGTMAEQLRPIASPYATVRFSIGLFAAGFTSVTTAPLAGAYTAAGALDWEADLTSTRFRAVWGVIVLVSGVLGGIATVIVIWLGIRTLLTVVGVV